MHSVHMTIETIAPEALKLSSSERARLASTLWASLEDPYELQCDLSDEAAIDLAIERDRQIESGEVKPVSHTDMMNRLRA